jgi:hypothetical protein
MRALILPLVLLLSSAASAQERLALVVGQNDGGEGRATLRFAERDAERFADVLIRLGGVAPEGLALVLGPDLESFDRSLSDLAQRAQAAQDAGRRVEVVVYYSGHADEAGLLLAGERVGFKELRAALTELPADVRVAVIDACAAGALTRAKGGAHVPGFLVDESSEMQGHAFLTAASETESAQESDRLGGSFFTHALMTGMRGAADTSGDGQVTLDEAYRYAFDETLSRTERSRIGPQHPGFDIQLTGQGELVMTDVRTASATLVLAESLEGQVFLRDGDGQLALEVRKPAGRTLQLGLEPGDYAVTLARGEERLGANLTLPDGAVLELGPAMFAQAVVDDAVVARGGESAVRAKPRTLIVPANVSLVPGLSTNDVAGGPAINLFSFDVLMGNTQELRGLSLGFGLGWVYGDVKGVQTSLLGAVAGGDVRGGQASLGASVAAQDVLGVQASTGVNVTAGTLRGLQLGSGLSYAGALAGAQVSVINIGGHVRGFQLGVINLARRVEGAQVGVINLAVENEGVGVGLISGALRGYNHVSVYASDLAPVNVSVQIGSKYLYTLLSGGYQPLPLSGALNVDTYSILSLGIGGHIPVGDFFVDLDVSGGTLLPNRTFDSQDQVLGVGRAIVGWQPEGQLFGVFGGVAVNSLVGIGRQVSAIGVGSQLGDGQGDLAVWPGVFVGVRL